MKTRTAGPASESRGGLTATPTGKDGDAGHRQQPRESRLAGEPAGSAEGGHGLHRRGPSSGDRYEPDAAGRSRATRSHRPWVDGRTERSMVVWRSVRDRVDRDLAAEPIRRSPSPSARHRSARDRTGGRRRAGRARGSAGTARTPRAWTRRRRASAPAVTPASAAWSPSTPPDEHGDQDGRDHRPRDGPADDVVDRVQPVAEHGDRHRDRDPRQRDPEQDRPVADQAGVQRRAAVDGAEQDDRQHRPLQLLALHGRPRRKRSTTAAPLAIVMASSPTPQTCPARRRTGRSAGSRSGSGRSRPARRRRARRGSARRR